MTLRQEINSLIWNIVIQRFGILLFQSLKVVESAGTIVTITARKTAFICCHLSLSYSERKYRSDIKFPLSTPNNYSLSSGSLYIFRFLTCPEILSIWQKDIPNAWKVKTIKSMFLCNWRFYFLVKLIYLKQTNTILGVLFCLIMQSHSL